MKSYYSDNRISTNYLFVCPIIDNFGPAYKYLANIIVVYQYIIIAFFLFEKRVILIYLWENWKKIP